MIYQKNRIFIYLLYKIYYYLNISRICGLVVFLLFFYEIFVNIIHTIHRMTSSKGLI